MIPLDHKIVKVIKPVKYYVQFNGEYSGGFVVEAVNESSAVELARDAAYQCVDRTIDEECFTVEEVKDAVDEWQK